MEPKKDFENLAQRSIYYFLATFPSFYPLVPSHVSETEQKEAYTFIKDIYVKLYQDPAILGFKLLPDDSLGDKEQQKEKPDLVSTIRKTIIKTEEFIALLWSISLKGIASGNTLTVNKNELDLKSSGIKQLSAFNVHASKLENSYLFSFPIGVNGLKLLAEVSEMNAKPPKDGRQKPYLLFSRGVFNVSAPWSREVFGNMLIDRKPFDKLIDFLEQQGYKRIDNNEYNKNISLDYIKNYGSHEDEVKSAWAERTHSGIEVIYEELRRNQLVVSLRIPYFKEILENADKMPHQVKDFLTSTTKKCDGCRYCVQTDKTGKRPLARIEVEQYGLCPLFPGFYYRWKTLEDRKVDVIIGTLEFIDDIFSDRRC